MSAITALPIGSRTVYRLKLFACLMAALGTVGVTHAQTLNGPLDNSSNDKERLSYKGITLYGTIDVGVQLETHGAPFSDFYTPASTNIVQKDSRETVTGMTGSNMSQSKIGLRGTEPIGGDWSGVFALETWFNPQAGQIADSIKSLTVNNGRTTGQQTTNNDGSSAGQAFQIAYVGLHSNTFGTLTFGRQQNLVSEGMNRLDPNRTAPAFSLLGASGAYAGAGTTEDKRLDSTAKYVFDYAGTAHVAALYKFNQSNASAGGTAFQVNLGGHYAGFSLEAYYSKVYDAVSAALLTSAQVAGLGALGFTSSNSVAATISDNTAVALLGEYDIKPVPIKLYAGFEHIQYANPDHPLAAGTNGLGGYTLAYVNNTAYGEDKELNVYWTGVRYSIVPKMDVVAAFYGYHQDAYGTTRTTVGCSSVTASTCSGNFRAYSLAVYYRFTKRFDAYAGAMYSSVSDGLANGYLYDTTNINPTIGVRFSF
jgi:predicted porin